MNIRAERTDVRDKPTEGMRRTGRDGYTLVETMVAAIVVGVAVMGAISAILSSVGVTRVNRDTAVARQAAQRRMEEIQSVPFQETFAAFNEDVGDDAALSVPAPGAGFAVPGLTPLEGDPDGMCGRITFPLGAGGAPGVLREDVVDPGLGMPLDLNLDAVLDGLDHSGDYVLLPVRVQVEWRGVTGRRRTELVTVLAAR